MNPTYKYSLERAPTLNDGYVTASGKRDKELYIANGTGKALTTGLALDIPRGVTVQVRGLPEHKRRGLSVIEEDLVGPLELPDLIVYIRNQADTTTLFKQGDPIAAVRAIETPKQLRFTERGVEVPVEPPAVAAQAEPPIPAARPELSLPKPRKDQLLT